MAPVAASPPIVKSWMLKIDSMFSSTRMISYLKELQVPSLTVCVSRVPLPAHCCGHLAIITIPVASVLFACSAPVVETTELYILWSELCRCKLSPTLATAHYFAIGYAGLSTLQSLYSWWHRCGPLVHIVHV